MGLSIKRLTVESGIQAARALWIAFESGRRLRVDEADLQGDAGHLSFIDRDIDGVGAVTGKGKLLEIQDQIAGREKEVVGKFHVERSFHGWDDRSAIFIDKQDADGVKPFLFLPEKDAKGDGTLGMNGGKRRGNDGIEGAKEAEFSVVIGRGIAEGGDLNFHAPKGEGAGRHGKRKFGLASEDAYFRPLLFSNFEIPVFR